MAIIGIDIASHQGPNFPFARARGEGYQFAIIKASGGHTYQNEYRDAQVKGARDAGLIVGFYHYMFEPSYGSPGNPSGGDVRREFQNFRAAVTPYVEEGTSFWLDVEEYPRTVGFTGDLGGWIVDFCEMVEAEFGCPCGVYCATWYLVPTGLNKDTRLARYPFWMASWQDAPPPQAAMAPWDHITLWQYDAHSMVAGRQPIDEDLFWGTREEFMALGVPGKTEEGTVREPGAEQAQTYINDRGETIFVANYGGQATRVLGHSAVDVGVSVQNAKGDIYDRSLQHDAFQKWVLRPKQDQG